MTSSYRRSVRILQDPWLRASTGEYLQWTDGKGRFGLLAEVAPCDCDVVKDGV